MTAPQLETVTVRWPEGPYDFVLAWDPHWYRVEPLTATAKR